MKIKIKRCQACADDLKEYNPYIDGEGKTIPLENIEVVIVATTEECDNTTFTDPTVVEK